MSRMCLLIEYQWTEHLKGFVCVTSPIKVTHCVLQPKLSDLLAMTLSKNLSGSKCQTVPLICNVLYCSLGLCVSWESGHAGPTVLSDLGSHKPILGIACSQSLMKNRCLRKNFGLSYSIIIYWTWRFISVFVFLQLVYMPLKY